MLIKISQNMLNKNNINTKIYKPAKKSECMC